MSNEREYSPQQDEQDRGSWSPASVADDKTARENISADQRDRQNLAPEAKQAPDTTSAAGDTPDDSGVDEAPATRIGDAHVSPTPQTPDLPATSSVGEGQDGEGPSGSEGAGQGLRPDADPERGYRAAPEPGSQDSEEEVPPQAAVEPAQDLDEDGAGEPPD